MKKHISLYTVDPYLGTLKAFREFSFKYWEFVIDSALKKQLESLNSESSKLESVVESERLELESVVESERLELERLNPVINKKNKHKQTLSIEVEFLQHLKNAIALEPVKSEVERGNTFYDYARENMTSLSPLCKNLFFKVLQVVFLKHLKNIISLEPFESRAEKREACHVQALKYMLLVNPACKKLFLDIMFLKHLKNAIALEPFESEEERRDTFYMYTFKERSLLNQECKKLFFKFRAQERLLNVLYNLFSKFFDPLSVKKTLVQCVGRGFELGVLRAMFPNSSFDCKDKDPDVIASSENTSRIKFITEDISYRRLLSKKYDFVALLSPNFFNTGNQEIPTFIDLACLYTETACTGHTKTLWMIEHAYESLKQGAFLMITTRNAKESLLIEKMLKKFLKYRITYQEELSCLLELAMHSTSPLKRTEDLNSFLESVSKEHSVYSITSDDYPLLEKIYNEENNNSPSIPVSYYDRVFLIQKPVEVLETRVSFHR